MRIHGRPKALNSNGSSGRGSALVPPHPCGPRGAEYGFPKPWSPVLRDDAPLNRCSNCQPANTQSQAVFQTACVDFGCKASDNAPMKTQDAIKHFGGRQQLADALGITRPAIYEWGETVPELRQYQIEVLSGGALRAERLDEAAA